MVMWNETGVCLSSSPWALHKRLWWMHCQLELKSDRLQSSKLFSSLCWLLLVLWSWPNPPCFAKSPGDKVQDGRKRQLLPWRQLARGRIWPYAPCVCYKKSSVKFQEIKPWCDCTAVAGCSSLSLPFPWVQQSSGKRPSLLNSFLCLGKNSVGNRADPALVKQLSLPPLRPPQEPHQMGTLPMFLPRRSNSATWSNSVPAGNLFKDQPCWALQSWRKTGEGKWNIHPMWILQPGGIISIWLPKVFFVWEKET